MIFITVGTHEQDFNRLLEYIDKLKEIGIIEENVIIQTGFSTYEPRYCKWEKLFSYQQMLDNINNARIVITHGGPSSFMMPLQVGKIPIVVPRQKKYNEHINDHQLEFAKAVVEYQGNIILVEEVEELEEIILNYDTIVKSMPSELKSNNKEFNIQLNKIVKRIFK